jgi:hypothetical protein
MRAAANQRHGGGHDQGSDPVLVREHDVDRCSLGQRLLRVIGVGQPEGDLARGHQTLDLAVGARDPDLVGLERVQEGAGLRVAPGGEECRDVHGRGPEERVGDGCGALPAGIGEIPD